MGARKGEATLEIPDPVFRKAKARAAERGIPLRQYVTEAVEEKLVATSAPAAETWMKMAGGLIHLHAETVRIQKLIDEEFEQVEPEDWGLELLSPGVARNTNRGFRNSFG